jgi:hypothetical protein
MDRELAELRRAVSDLGPRRAGRRIPSALRARIVEVVGERRSSGGGLSSLAAALGLRVATLSRWVSASETVPVVGGVRPLPVVMRETSAGLTLVSPGGWRLEGLSVVSAAELLDRLR